METQNTKSTKKNISNIFSNEIAVRNRFVQTACTEFGMNLSHMSDKFAELILFIIECRLEHTGKEFNRENVYAETDMVAEEYCIFEGVKDAIDDLYLSEMLGNDYEKIKYAPKTMPC